MSSQFERALRQLRKHDPQLREDAFHTLRPHAADHLPELIAEFHRPDAPCRPWLLELIGEARSPDALPLLVEQLNSRDEALRDWAKRGLELLNTKEARQALWAARQ